MVEENTGVSENSPSPLADAIASSPEALQETPQTAQESQTPALQEVSQEQPVEESRVPYSRLKEVVDEKNYYRQLLEKSIQQQQSQQQIQQPTTDPYAGMTPEEEKFFRNLDARAERIAEQKIKQISPVIEAGRMELAQLKVQQFRNSHPDIKANSPEEVAIAEKITMGYLPEDAYRVVMYDKQVANTEKQITSQYKQKIEAKKQANVEQRSMSANNPLPVKENLTLKQRIEREAAKLDPSAW